MPSRQAQNGQVDHMSTLEQRWRVPCALARWSACIVALLTCVWGSASEVSRAASAGPQTLPHSELTLYYYDFHWTGGRDVCTPGDNWCGWATPAPKVVVYGTMTTTLPVPPGSTAVGVTIRIPCNGWGEGRPDVECHWGIYDAARTPKPTRNLFLLCTPYDFNSDRIIDIVDIALVASRWLDPAAYDVRYDVAPPGAPDGVIDIADIAAVAGRFGQSCST